MFNHKLDHKYKIEFIVLTWGLVWIRTKAKISRRSLRKAENRYTKEKNRGTDLLVPYAWANINKCLCSECPVQADSKYAQDKLRSSKKEMEKMPAGEVPNLEDVPGIYCSTGKARCQDLNFERQCICSSCEVWKEYDLKDVDPNNHFCQHGRAV
jgi:hypothetical protein